MQLQEQALAKQNSEPKMAPTLPLRNVLLVGDNIMVLSNAPNDDAKTAKASQNKSRKSRSTTKKSSSGKKKEQPELSGANSNVDAPRVNKQLTMDQLKYEAYCRGIHEKNQPKLKVDLYNLLGAGTILLSETPAWQQVEQMKVKIAQQTLEKIQQRSLRRLADQGSDLVVATRNDTEGETRLSLRQQEIERQKPLHKSFFPRVHDHLLAPTQELRLFGDDRGFQAKCSVCNYVGACVWTCELCEFDICQKCFNINNMTEAQKAMAREEARKEREELHSYYESLQEQQRLKQEEEERLRKESWVASRHFKSHIIDPPQRNKMPEGCTKVGYTVWCSHFPASNRSGDSKDEWKKTFDTTWSNKEDANERALYLFLWCNALRLEPEQMQQTLYEESEREGLKVFNAEAHESGSWRVAVVPDVAFLHLPGATMERHNYTDIMAAWEERRKISRMASF